MLALQTFIEHIKGGTTVGQCASSSASSSAASSTSPYQAVGTLTPPGSPHNPVRSSLTFAAARLGEGLPHTAPDLPVLSLSEQNQPVPSVAEHLTPILTCWNNWVKEEQQSPEDMKNRQFAFERVCSYLSNTSPGENSLTLANCNLSKLPEVFSSEFDRYIVSLPPSIEELNLSSNKFQTLPFIDAPNLKRLYLANSQIETWFGLIAPNIETIDLSGNHLNSVPEWMMRLPPSCTVWLSGNPLSQEAIAQLEGANDANSSGQSFSFDEPGSISSLIQHNFAKATIKAKFFGVPNRKAVR